STYQVAPAERDEKQRESHRHLQGRWLFGRELSYRALSARMQQGGTIKATRLTDEFDYAAFQREYRDQAIPLFVISESKRLSVVSADQKLTLKPGQTIIALVPKIEQSPASADAPSKLTAEGAPRG